MTMGPDLDIIREIPGYKVILKAILKHQIRTLVEQLSLETDEESIFLTASITDGTLSHLGSNFGIGFLDSNEDLKAQFLGFCLKERRTQDGQKKKQSSEQSSSSKQSPSSFGPIRSSSGRRIKATPKVANTSNSPAHFAKSVRMEPYTVVKPTVPTPTSSTSWVEIETDDITPTRIKLEPIETDDMETAFENDRAFAGDIGDRNVDEFSDNFNVQSMTFKDILTDTQQHKSRTIQNTDRNIHQSENIPSTSTETGPPVNEDDVESPLPMKLEEVDDTDIELDMSGAHLSNLDSSAATGSSADMPGTERYSRDVPWKCREAASQGLTAVSEASTQTVTTRKRCVKRKIDAKAIKVKYSENRTLRKGLRSNNTEIALQQNECKTTRTSLSIKTGLQSYDPEQKCMTTTKWRMLDTALLEWYSYGKEARVIMTTEILLEKAEKYAKELGLFKVSRTELSDWLDVFKKRHDINLQSTGKWDKLDTCLFKWFSYGKEEGALMTTEILLEKAEKYAKELGLSEFSRTKLSDWLNMFKKRHDINLQSTEKLDKLDTCLFKWFSYGKEEGALMTTEILLAKADKYAKELGLTDFSFTFYRSGWLELFKTRHGINLQLTGKWEEFDTGLFEWFNCGRKAGALMSAEILLAKADKYAKELGLTVFSQTDLSVWLDVFQKRHDINLQSTSG